MKNKHIFNIHKKWKILSTAAILFVAALSTTAFTIKNLNTFHDVDATAASEINPPDQTKLNLNVLVVEINPTLKTVPGNPKVADYVYPEETSGDHVRTTVEETVSDLEWSSGGFLEINTIWNYLDEYPRYKKNITLPDGSVGNSLDEANLLLAAGGQSGVEGYYNIGASGWMEQVKTGDFDYNYLINRLDLVNRRNRGEFDQVWIVYIEPSGAYETMMVGKSAYWVNGAEVIANCDDFIMAGFNVGRRDSQLHALGHAYEQIMERVYGSRFNTYDEADRNSVNISTKEQYMALNLWERFTLNDYVNAGTLNGVGTVHHPFNADREYDYTNSKIVNSTYQEWENGVSNMQGNSVPMNNSVWDSAPYNDSGPNLASGRYYMRFWLHRFPREVGYTSDGYLKNWWKYLFSLRSIKKITYQTTPINVGKNEEISLDYEITYDSDEVENRSITKKYENVVISDSNVVEVKNGKLVAKNAGRCTITVYMEGLTTEREVVVGKQTQTVSFTKSSITKESDDSAFTNAATTTGDGTITYTSSNRNVATVDSRSGLVTIVGAGSTTITATAAATDSYAEGSASYTLTVKNAQPSGDTDDDHEQDDGGDDEQDGENDDEDQKNGKNNKDDNNKEKDTEDNRTILPDTSAATDDPDSDTKDEATAKSSAKASIETPNTGSATSNESGNIPVSYPTLIVIVVVAALSIYGTHRHKTHRKFD